MKATNGRWLSRKLHLWLSVIIGIQSVIWVVSGFYMVVVDIDFIHGDSLVRHTNDGFTSSATLLHQPEAGTGASSITLMESMGRLFYLERSDSDIRRIDAHTGERLNPLTEIETAILARHYYAGEGSVASVSLITSNAPQEASWLSLPVWMIQFDDQLATTFYIDPLSGKLLTRRHDYWRLFDIFWMLHIMDYDTRDDAQNRLLTAATLAALLASLSGLWLLFYRLSSSIAKASTKAPRGFEPVCRFLHKWLSLLIGLQFLIWVGSGLGMNLMDFDAAAGAHTRAKPLEMQQHLSAPNASFQNILKQYSDTPVKELRLMRWQDRYIYRVQTADKRYIHSAVDGSQMEIDANTAQKLAQASYTGAGTLVEQKFINSFNTETRHYKGPSWAHRYNDEADTTVYISAEDGRLLAHRNNEWRRFDFFWMLHIMDFDRREDINNGLVIGFAFGSLWLALTGLILVFTSLRRSSAKAGAADH